MSIKILMGGNLSFFRLPGVPLNFEKDCVPPNVKRTNLVIEPVTKGVNGSND